MVLLYTFALILQAGRTPPTSCPFKNLWLRKRKYGILLNIRNAFSGEADQIKKRKWTFRKIQAWRKEHGGWFYINKADSNIFIRKPYGISWTINLGNPLSYLVFAGIFGAVAGLNHLSYLLVP